MFNISLCQGLSLAVSVEHVVGIKHQIWIYDALMASDIEGSSNGPSSGGTSFTIFGLGFGLNGCSSAIGLGSISQSGRRIDKHVSSCLSSRWASSSVLTCKLSAGIGWGFPFANAQQPPFYLTIDLQEVAGKFSSALFGDSLLTSLFRLEPDLSASTGSMLVVLGTRFSLVDSSSRLRINSAHHPSEFGRSSSDMLIWSSDSAIACKSAQGVVSNVQIEIVISTSSVDRFIVVPRINKITNVGPNHQIATSDIRVPSSGSVYVIMIGHRFLLSDWSVSCRLGFSFANTTFFHRTGTAVRVSRWWSDSAIACKFGERFGHRYTTDTSDKSSSVLTMTIIGQTRHTLPIVMHTPQSNPQLVIRSAAQTGYSVVSIASWAWFADVCASSRFGHTAMESSQWKSGTSLKCKLPIITRSTNEQSHSFIPVCVTFIGTTCIDSSPSIVEKLASVSSVSVLEFSRTDSTSVSIYGSSFRTCDVSPKISFIFPEEFLTTANVPYVQKSRMVCNWVSDSSIVTKIPIFDFQKISLVLSLGSNNFLSLFDFPASEHAGRNYYSSYPFLSVQSQFFMTANGEFISCGILNPQQNSSSIKNCRTSVSVYNMEDNVWRILSSCSGKEKLDLSCIYRLDVNYVICFGGRDTKTSSASSEMWQLVINNNSWIKLNHAPKALYLHAMALSNNEIFVAGGISDSGISKTSFKYDITLSTWMSLPNMKSSAASCTASSRDEYIFVLCYSTFDDATNSGALVQRFEKVSNTWNLFQAFKSNVIPLSIHPCGEFMCVIASKAHPSDIFTHIVCTFDPIRMKWVVERDVRSSISLSLPYSSQIVGAAADGAFGSLKIFLRRLDAEKLTGMMQIFIVQVIAGISNANFSIMIGKNALPKINSSVMETSTGSAVSFFHGAQFGLRSASAIARLDNSACMSTVWKSDSAVECRSAGVLRKAHTVILSIQMMHFIDSTNMATGTQFSYFEGSEKPLEMSLQPELYSKFPSTGGSMAILSININTFGLFDYSNSARVEISSIAVSKWISDTSLNIRTSKFYSDVKFVVTHANTRLALPWKIPDNFSDLGSIMTVKAPPLVDSTTGSIIIPVYGAMFGMSDITPRIRSSISACERTLWIAESNLFCKFQNRIRSLAEVVVTAESKFVYEKNLVNIQSVVEDTVLSIENALTGSRSIFIFGKIFFQSDVSISARHEKSAGMATFWISNSMVTVKLQPQFRNSSEFIKISFSAYQNSTLKVPSETYIFFQSYSVKFENVVFPSTGAALCGFIGMSFSSDDRSISATIGNTAAQSSMWLSTTSSKARSSSLKMPESQLIMTFANNRLLKYAKNLNGSSMCIQKSEIDFFKKLVSSGSTVIFFEMNSGSTVKSLSLKLGKSSCSWSHWISDSVALCKASQKGVTLLQEVVLITSTTSVEICFRNLSYESVHVQEFMSLFSSATSSQILTLAGHGFGVIESCIKTRLSTASENSRWLADSIIFCRISDRSSLKKPLVLSTAELYVMITRTVNHFGNFSKLFIQSFGIPHTGKNLVMVHGIDFSSSMKVKIASSTAERSDWTSQSSMQLKSSALAIALKTSAVCDIIFSIQSTKQETVFVSTMVTFDAILTQMYVSSASDWPVILSNHFGRADSSIRMRILSTACDVSKWVSSSSLTCKYYSSNFASASVCITLNNPAICVNTNVLILNGSKMESSAEIDGITTTGGQILVLKGSRFGGAGVTLSLRHMHSTCSFSNWHSDSFLRCKIAAGQPETSILIPSMGRQELLGWNNLYSISNSKPNLGTVQNLKNTVFLNGNGFSPFPSPSTKISSVQSNVFEKESIVAATINVAAEFESKTISSISSNIEFLGAIRLDRFKLEIISPSKAKIHLASNFCRGCMLSNISFIFADWGETNIPDSNCSQFGTYKPDGPSISSSFGEQSYGIWQLLVSSDEILNQNTVITASITITFDDRNVLIAGVPALITYWTSDSSASAVYGRISSTRNSSIQVLVRKKSSSTLFQMLESAAPQILNLVKTFSTCTGSQQALKIEGVSLSFTAALGRQLQSVDPSPKLKVGHSSCSSSRWVSDSSATCKSVMRSPISNSVSLSINLQKMNFVDTNTSFIDWMLIQAFNDESSRLTSGSKHLSFAVLNAGVNDYTSKLRLARCCAEAQRWVSESSISGKSAASSSKMSMSYSIFISLIENVCGSASFSIAQGKYFLKVENSIEHISLLISSSSLSLTVIGMEFGAQLSSCKIRIRRSSCESSEWLSASAIRCKASSSAISLSVNFRTTLDAVLSTGESASRTELRHISEVSSSMLPISSSVLMKLLGTFGNFDTSAASKLSGTNSEAQVWLAHTCMALKAPQNSKLALTLHYTSNQIVWKTFNIGSSLNAELLVLNAIFMSTGSTFAFLHGLHFAKQDHSSQVRLKSSAIQSSSWHSDSSVNIKTANCLSNVFLILLSINERMIQNATFPRFKSINEWSTMMLLSEASGGRLVVFSGMNTGKSAQSLLSKVDVTTSENSIWISDSSIVSKQTQKIGTFKISGILQVSLADNQHTSGYTNLINYDAQNSTEISRALDSLSFTSSHTLQIWGSTHSTFSTSLKVLLGFTSCQDTRWTSFSSILCKTHSADAIIMKICLSNGNSDYNWQSRLYRSNSTDSSRRPNNFPATGSSVLQVLGRDFSAFDLCSQLKTGYTACESSAWTSSSKAASKVARSTNSQNMHMLISVIQHRVLKQDNTLQTDRTDPAFNISQIKTLWVPSSGSVQVSIFGRTVLTMDKTTSVKIR
jgi:hypothetical protein